MNPWYGQIQTAVHAIDAAIQNGDDEQLTLQGLASSLGYSPFHMTRMFKAMSGLSLREYLRGRRLAFALLDVRDGHDTLLAIALRYGFSSHEAFTRAFKAAYGVTPGEYRRHPAPVVLRTRILPLDRYLLGTEGTGMLQSGKEINIYYTRVPAHSFLHIKNYQSDGYWDFWQKQDEIPGQDCDTICGLLDSVKGKLDGDDGDIGTYSGQIMARLPEADGRTPEAYGVRLPVGYAGPVPAPLLMLDVPEGEYIVFEHGPFDFETQAGGVLQQLDAAVAAFPWQGSGYAPHNAPGRPAYYYHDPARFIKRVLPVQRV